MCGIAGILIYKNFSNSINFSRILDAMALYIKNRGPDNKQKWISEEDKIAMVHTRLSIIGIGENGNQPMISNDGRYILSFNGEIYNYQSLKKDLDKKFKLKWRGTSDTEVLLEGIALEGFENFIKKIEGMFAIALWDKRKKSLFLVRDRIGEKPLYYGQINNNEFKSFVFSSDIGSLTTLSDNKLEIDYLSLSDFLNNGWVTAPKSIYKEVKKVLPGEYLEINLLENNIKLDKKKYWNLNYNNESNKSKLSFEDSIKDLNDLLIKVLKDQMYCEREKAIFFSGGIDSTLIAVLAKKELAENIKCITCGFGKEFASNNYDERIYAKRICKNLDIPHIERIIRKKDVIETLPYMSTIFSEPFGDISQIGTYLVAKKAREMGIIVALGGDGGDELFGGYQRYLSGPKFLLIKRLFPNFFIESIYKNFQLIPELIQAKIFDVISVDNYREKLDKIFNNFENINNIDSLYLSCLTKWEKNDFSKLGFGEYESPFIEYMNYKNHLNIKKLDFRSYMMDMDLRYFLADDVLVKTDRASMGVGLETRSPFLNHKIVEYARCIPNNKKFKFNNGKLHLRKIISNYIDLNLIERPKKGFTIPIDNMLRTTVKTWANDMLFYLKKNNEFSLNTSLIDKIWDEHISGKKNHGNCLWNLIMLSSWMQVWRK